MSALSPTPPQLVNPLPGLLNRSVRRLSDGATGRILGIGRRHGAPALVYQVRFSGAPGTILCDAADVMIETPERVA